MSMVIYAKNNPCWVLSFPLGCATRGKFFSQTRSNEDVYVSHTYSTRGKTLKVCTLISVLTLLRRFSSSIFRGFNSGFLTFLSVLEKFASSTRRTSRVHWPGLLQMVSFTTQTLIMLPCLSRAWAGHAIRTKILDLLWFLSLFTLFTYLFLFVYLFTFEEVNYTSTYRQEPIDHWR